MFIYQLKPFIIFSLKIVTANKRLMSLCFVLMYHSIHYTIIYYITQPCYFVLLPLNVPKINEQICKFE